MLYLWLPLVGFAAAAFSTVSGFGGGIVLIAFATLVLDMKEVVPLSTIFFFSLSLVQLLLFRRNADWRTVRLYCLGALPGILAGMALFDVLPAAVLKRAVGVVVLGFVAHRALGRRPGRSPSPALTAGVSAVAGAVDALTASGGPVQAPLFLARGLRKEAFVASFAATSVILNPLKVALYGSMGYVDAGDAGLAAALSAAGLLGVLAGRSLLRRISPEAFHRLALGFLVLLALKLLVLG